MRGRILVSTLLIGFVCLGVHSDASSDQQKPDQPVFRSAVDVAVIDVTVVDDDGRPVRGLTAADFVVKVAGQPRRIQALDFLEFGGRTVEASATEPSTAASSNTVGSSTTRGLSRGGRIIVVAVDDLSSRPVGNAGLLASAERILATLDPTDLVGLITTSGFGPLVAPTSNRDEFRSALRNKTIVGRNESITTPFFITDKEASDADNRSREVGWLNRECPPPTASPDCGDRAMSAARRLGAEVRHRRDQQLSAYAAIIEGLKTLPRPRVLIVLGQGLGLDGYSGRGKEIDRLGRLAADADVRFYSLTDIDDGASASMQGSADKCEPPRCISHYRARQNETSFLLGGMQILAAATGGEALRSIGQADRLLDRVVSETSGLYRLGVEVPAGVAEKYPKLEVSTPRRGLTIRATRHLAPERGERATVPIEELLRQRIALGGHSFGIPVTVAALIRGEPAAPRQEAAISVRVPAAVSAPLSLMFALVDDQGKVTSGTKDIAPHTPGEDHEVTMVLAVTSKAQGYRLRVAVADADGRIGSVESRVRNTVTAAGEAQVSQVFLNWSTSSGRNLLAFDVAPRTATALSCTMDVYPGSIAPADIRVAFAISRDGDPVPVVSREITPQAGGGLTATMTVPIAQLPAGAYSIIATVMAGARSLGSQSATFSIPRLQ
jgi:VWFA-related protein